MDYRSSFRSERRGRLLPTRSLRLGRRRRIPTLCESLCQEQECTKSPREHGTPRARAAMSRNSDGTPVASVGAEGRPGSGGSRIIAAREVRLHLKAVHGLRQINLKGLDRIRTCIMCIFYLLAFFDLALRETIQHIYQEGFSLCSQGKTTALPSCILITENVLLGSRFCNHSAATRPDCLLISLVA